LQAPCPDVYRGLYKDVDYPNSDMGEVYASDVQKIVDNIRANGKGVAAFIAESLQSCGGQIFPPEGYFQRIYDIVRKAGGVTIGPLKRKALCLI